MRRAGCGTACDLLEALYPHPEPSPVACRKWDCGGAWLRGRVAA